MLQDLLDGFINTTAKILLILFCIDSINDQDCANKGANKRLPCQF